VRNIQIFHRGWDAHGNLVGEHSSQCKDIDQGSAALIKDLKRRGMLDDTLVVWGGEFGRTAYCQGNLKKENYGRDHHPRCFSIWMAGGGVKAGITYGKTDDFGYNIAHADGTPMRPKPDKHKSTISTPPSSTCSASTTKSSPTATSRATSASPMCMVMWCMTSWPEEWPAVSSE